MSPKPSVICQLADFSAKPPTSFVDALLCLALHCRDRFGTETFCILPEEARRRSWLERFEEKGILHGFLPEDRNSFLHIRRLLAKYQPQVFHSHFVSYDLSSVLLKVLSYQRSKVIWHLHSPSGTALPQRAKDAVKARLVARLFVDRFIAVGEGAFDNARARGFSDDKLLLIHNGIDVSRFHTDDEARRRVRASLGVREDQLVYLLLGQDPYTKGVDLFLKAANQIVSTVNSPNLFLIIGEAETRRFVTSVTEARGLGSALRVIDPIDDFASFLSGVDIVVSSSRREGFGCAIAEAMAAARLIVLSDIPGARGIYGGSPGVWFFQPEDWMMQAACMTKARELSIPERQMLGEANARYVAEHYGLRGWAEQMGNVYETLLE